MLSSSLLRNSQGTALGIIIMGSNSHCLSLCPTVNSNKVLPVIAASLKLFSRVIRVRNITWWQRSDHTDIIDCFACCKHCELNSSLISRQILCRCLYATLQGAVPRLPVSDCCEPLPLLLMHCKLSEWLKH